MISIPLSRTCKHCGTSFAPRRSDQPHCAACRALTFVCEECGLTFRPPGALSRARPPRFCSRACLMAHTVHSFTCQHCGVIYDLPPHRKRTKFCSKRCAGLAKRRLLPRRKHGYDARYDAWRAAVVARDRVCQGIVERNGALERCGATENLHANHIYGWTAFPERRYDLDNGLVLCAPCHQLRHPECGVGSRPRTRPSAQCIVCGRSISGRGTTGCCRWHWKGLRHPARTSAEQHRSHGRACRTCGIAVVNGNVSGFCKACIGPYMREVKLRQP